jgi:hypothetical protein
MSYDSGMNFGYDQIFVNPASGQYFDERPPASSGRNNIELDLMKKIKELESSEPNEYSPKRSFGGCDCKNHGAPNEIDRESLRQALMELQRKNDMLTMFIVFLVVFIVMQYNTFNQGVHYANTLSMSRLSTMPAAPTMPLTPTLTQPLTNA